AVERGIDDERSWIALTKRPDRYADAAWLRIASQVERQRILNALRVPEVPARDGIAVGDRARLEAIVRRRDRRDRHPGAGAAVPQWRAAFGRKERPARVATERANRRARGQPTLDCAVRVPLPVHDDQDRRAGRQTLEYGSIVLLERGFQREVVRRLESAGAVQHR